MIGATGDHPAAPVDALVTAIVPNIGSPMVHRRDVVVVTGPWLSGVTSVLKALRESVPAYRFIEARELAAGDAPTAVVFVVSAATPLTASDCMLLDVAAEHTDVVIGVVSKIDIHRSWREVLAANQDILAAHAPRYGAVPWLGVAAAPDLGIPHVDDLVATVQARLADADSARRNRLRAWESRLRTVSERFDRDAVGAGRGARVGGLREQRSAALRHRRQSRTERGIALRGQIQQARVELSHFSHNRCASVRAELQEDIASLPRRGIAEFETYTRRRVEEAVAEVADGISVQLRDIAEAMSMPVQLPHIDALPTVSISAPSLRSRRPETQLMMVLGAGFGLGLALTLIRLLSGLAAGLGAGLTAAGIVVCVTLGLLTTVWVVNTRGLLSDRAMLDRWTAEVTSSLRSALEQLVASRVLAAEALLGTALSAYDEVEDSRVEDRVNAIDSELREHAIAAARAAASRDREMPAIQAALDAVRAELAESGIRDTTLDSAKSESVAEPGDTSTDTSTPATAISEGFRPF
ncbi:hypothetical protein MB901379_00359 [Mycobacterium basiliense]|uniref:Uncharacterized protein n=1 Tax=Mycobacterium basiliense TaxID=2094119 RepID=A0A3S4C8B0_9MYCO|nr:hypothetical protein [Mycobacterium basiliense]VDM86833.1 hypothetical protein MB901379_00359 [Mycobacterium basiliense]